MLAVLFLLGLIIYIGHSVAVVIHYSGGYPEVAKIFTSLYSYIYPFNHKPLAYQNLATSNVWNFIQSNK